MDLSYLKVFENNPINKADKKMREESFAHIARVLSGTVEVRKNGKLCGTIPDAEYFLKQFGKLEKDVEIINGSRSISI